MLKKLVILLVALVGGVLIYAATRPSDFRVERSITINAAPEKVFPLINNLRQWEWWSPWEKVDPQLKRSYSGALEGQGAIYGWSGNRDIGTGRMEIVQSTPPSRIVLQLQFIEPMEARNTVEFVLAGEGGTTQVTQAMYGPRPFMSKLVGLVFDMDKMVGDKYEEGLANLKQLAEK